MTPIRDSDGNAEEHLDQHDTLGHLAQSSDSGDSSVDRLKPSNGDVRTLEEDLGDQDYTREGSDSGSIAGARSAGHPNEVETGIALEEATLPPEDAGNEPGALPQSQSSSASTPEDSQSVSGSVRSNLSPSPALPFERRLLARKGSSRPGFSRNVSPAFLTVHSRQASTSSQASQVSQSSQDVDEREDDKPWELIKWSRLKKLSSQALSEAGKRAFGQPTCLIASASLILGTSKGLILVFDYHQVLKHVIGQGTPAQECGAITALAISADHTAVAGGHANGSILTWDLRQPAKCFLLIPSLAKKDLGDRKVDGHIEGCAVLHLGFLGMRRTALASADDSGMAFSHLATRGLGAVARSVKTTRLLGRYPDADTTTNMVRRPSSVLAFSTLPLGNIEHDTDQFGLTALLTPYLLVIVSTTPIAQTQFKSPRAKNVAAHSAMTGCLCWFPSVKVRNSKESSKTKLAFCWSNVLSVVEVEAVYEGDEAVADKRPSLNFAIRTRWACEEPILAVQWLSRSVLAVLTITQRMLILEDGTMNLAGTSDLNHRHLYHRDVFSRQLNPLVDRVDEQEDATLHGVIPDAYHMSVKAYKGRLFALGFNEVAMGILSNWADRLSALMEAGRYIEAIELATSYYSGSSEKTTVGLPDDDDSRHELVRSKLLEMISASFRYVFKADDHDELETGLPDALEALVQPVFHACLTMNEMDVLMNEVYEWYSNASCQDKFLYALEGLILEGRCATLPTEILKDMTNWYSSLGLAARLEEMICTLDTTTMDLDQVTSLCRQYRLYDAFIHVWNTAIHDFVTPIIELLRVGLKSQPNNDAEREMDQESAMKLFPYMAYTLTGRIYPGGEEMSADRAVSAKSSVYAFLLAPKAIRWPQPSGPLITIANAVFQEPYPYLRLVARFNSSDFMSMLNEAFEDAFLNDDEEQYANGKTHGDLNQLTSSLKITRERIVNILWDVYSDPSFSMDDRIYLDIFLARNLAKFHQGFIRLPEAKLKRILTDLCEYPSPAFLTDCQLSVEYLLSVYRPPDIRTLIPQLQRAQFYRVLKATYRSERQFLQCLETYFLDSEDQEEVFETIRTFLRIDNTLSVRQISEIKSSILRHAGDLARIDVRRFATLLQAVAQDLLEPVCQKLPEGSYARFQYLQTLVDPGVDPQAEGRELPSLFLTRHVEGYVELMCKHDPQHVIGYINSLKSGDLRLSEVLPAMESSGVIDAAVMLMARDGLAKDAMSRLTKHLSTVQSALLGIIKHPESEDEGSANHLLSEAQKYVRIGIWLCQGEAGKHTSEATMKRRRFSQDITEAQLQDHEMLWLDLVTSVVDLSRAISTSVTDPNATQSQAIQTLRQTAQSVFTSLLTSTSSTVPNSSQPVNASFIPILSAFLTRTSTATPTLSDLRHVLADIFAAYAFEESMLSLSNQLIDKNVFQTVHASYESRRRGWRPVSSTCEVCGRKIWGTGAGSQVWDAWRAAREKQTEAAQERARPLQDRDATESHIGKGKEREKSVADGDQTVETAVSFACGHLVHESCLQKALAKGADEDAETRCVVCT